MSTSEKICPTCNKANEVDASVCQHCGEWLEEEPTRVVAVPDLASGSSNTPAETVESFIDIASIPEDGVGIYVAGAFKPYYVHVNKELVIGRTAEAALEATLDLSELGAFGLGVSRRHAVIRRTATGFEVLDLSSRNGTWLNAERLLPNRPYPFASGSQLRIGQMRLLVMYPPVPNHSQKS